MVVDLGANPQHNSRCAKGGVMDTQNSLAVIGANEIVPVLAGREIEIIEVIRQAYSMHVRGRTNCPHSLFLTFPHDCSSRIIALPAYAGETVRAAGVKWISSFPPNLKNGLPRASALIVLNSVETGRAFAVLEGSIISAKRTAASAALAATQLLSKPSGVDSIGMVGCGEINREILGFIKKAVPSVKSAIVFDTDRGRLRRFQTLCENSLLVTTTAAASVEAVLNSSRLISIATTATRPHIDSLPICDSSTVVLHISLRDLAPQIILRVDNVVDDLDHVCRANTSIELAAKSVGHVRFVRASIGDIIEGVSAPNMGDGRTVVFSPFGLGVLDVCLASFVYSEIMKQGETIVVPDFHANGCLSRVVEQTPVLRERRYAKAHPG
jgi:2,3-diaminopropionate biosynthesis protein SbnB